MAVTYSKPVKIDVMAWDIAWTSDAALPVTFRVYSEGVLLTPDGLVSEDGAGRWTLTVPPGDFPFFEVLDKGCRRPSIAFSGHLVLQWYGTGSLHYRVEKNTGSWVLQEIVPDDGRGYFTWRSGWLADVTTHTYRIVPVSTASNQGTALSLISLLVRHPDSPNTVVTYNGSVLKTIHIAAA